MKYLLLLILGTLLLSCKTSSHTKCDAYSQKEIKKDHQII